MSAQAPYIPFGDLAPGAWNRLSRTIQGGSVLRRLALVLASVLFPILIRGSALAVVPDHRLDPWLRMIVSDVSRGRNPLAAGSGSRIAELVEIEEGPGGSVLVGVLIRTAEIGATIDGVRELGGVVGVIAGSVVTARMPVQVISMLVERPETLSVEVGHVSRPRLNVSRVEVGADLVNAGVSLPAANTGKGVVVGVVDTGIDYRHPDFSTSSGTRFLGIWDVSGVSGSVPRLCDPASINAGTCPEVDVDGHGTHVSGTAAGNGRALAGYGGMAPEAGILFAKATRSTAASPSFANSDVIAACQWIFDKAQALGKAAVINLSIGGHFGPHDGTSNYEMALSSLVGPGRVIVAAAGNEGNDLIHVSYSTAGSDFASAMETEWQMKGLPTASGVSFSSRIDAWYPSGSVYFGVAVRDLSGTVLGGAMGVGPGGLADNVLVRSSGGTPLAYVTVDARTVSDANNSNRHVLITVTNGGGSLDLRPYVFSLVTWGSGSFDAWIVDSASAFTSYADMYFRAGDSLKTVGTPGTATRLIAVAAYTTKTQWVDFNGVTRNQTSCGVVNEIACFSSRGPTRDGRIKPEISAPGQVILAPYSSSATGNHTQADVLQGGSYLKEQGTSMASPHVTGIVALMLQAKPTLTPEQALTALQQSARRDSFTGAAVNTTWGAGKVNALEAVKAVGGGGGATVCTEDATTMCLVGGRYKVTSHWRNQYAGGATATLSKARLTDVTGAFWVANASTYEYLIRFNTATNNNRVWIAIPTFTDVEYWIAVTDTRTGQSYEYHSPAGNRTLLYDPNTFVYP